MEKTYRHSRQRDKILDLLRSTGKHPTASWVYDRLKKEFPDLSLGTVYRNLNILTEQGLIRKIDFGSTYDRYDANISRHYHFICERCGSISDLDLPVKEVLNEEVDKAANVKTMRHRIEFFGICENCLTTFGRPSKDRPDL